MNKLVWLFLLPALLAPPGLAVADLLSSQMVDQARAWSQKGRDDLAAEVWSKLLLVETRHPEALIELGLIEARAGHTKEAQALLRRASQLAKAPNGLKELTAILTPVAEVPPTPARAPAAKPEPARGSVQTGKVVPPPMLAPLDLAEWTSTGAITQRWGETRRSLEQLAREKPHDHRYLVALAVHLTHREATRREAVRQLDALTQRGLGTAQTQKAWQQALLALSPRAGDRTLFSSYLARFSGDSVIAERLGVLERQAATESDGKVPAMAADDEKTAVREAALAALHEARLLATRQQWAQALSLLERVAPTQRTADMVKEQRSLWVRAQARRARQFFEQGELQQAQSALEAAQAAAGQNDALLITVAAGWVDLGQPGKGLPLLPKKFTVAHARQLDSAIKLAEVLMATRQDEQLTAILRDLSAPGRLNPAQRDEVNNIILRYTLRLTETLRETGRFADATALLAPVLRASDDLRPQLAMARIHKSAGQPAAGLRMVERAIAREPQDIGHRLLAVELALADKNGDKADEHIKAALKVAPDHPRLLAVAGRVEQLRGDATKASGYFQRAQLLEREPRSFAGAPALLSLRLLGGVPDTAPASTELTALDRLTLLPVPSPARRIERPIPPAAAAASNSVPDGRALLASGENGAAVQSFAAILRQQPGEPTALNNLGVAKAAAGEFGAAFDLLSQAHARAPRRADIRENFDHLRRWTGRYTDGGTALTQRPPVTHLPLPALWSARSESASLSTNRGR